MRHLTIKRRRVGDALAIDRRDDVAGAEAHACCDAAAVERLDEHAGRERIETCIFRSRWGQRHDTRATERVGVLLPNANGVAVAVFALFAYDRVPAMLNFTASAIDLDAACRSVEATTIITSHRFVDAANLSGKLAAFAAGRKVVYLEDVRESVGLAARLKEQFDPKGILNPGRMG